MIGYKYKPGKQALNMRLAETWNEPLFDGTIGSKLSYFCIRSKTVLTPNHNITSLTLGCSSYGRWIGEFSHDDDLV